MEAKYCIEISDKLSIPGSGDNSCWEVDVQEELNCHLWTRFHKKEFIRREWWWPKKMSPHLNTLTERPECPQSSHYEGFSVSQITRLCKQFAWRHYYWHLPSEGIQCLHDYLHLALRLSLSLRAIAVLRLAGHGSKVWRESDL